VALPSETVTFVFTDIEGSTRRWDNDPEVMRTPDALHDVVLRSASGCTILSAVRRIQPDHAE